MTDPSPDPSAAETPPESRASQEPTPPDTPSSPPAPLSGVPLSGVPLSGVPASEGPSSESPSTEPPLTWAPPEPPQPKAPIFGIARAAVLVALGIGVLGVAVGWLWAEIAPGLQVIKSDRGFLYADAEPEQPIAGDGLFLFLGVGLGILLAVLVWVLLRRYRGAAMLVALSVGSLVGAAL